MRRRVHAVELPVQLEAAHDHEHAGRYGDAGNEPLVGLLIGEDRAVARVPTDLSGDNTLYTLTYKWPNIPLDPPRRCDRIPGFFNRHLLNEKLKTARFVGPEILQAGADRHVDHWRVGVVGGSTQPGEVPRFPIALGDVYVDQGDRSQWWQVLQFGFQNLFDPELDEWFRMTTFSHVPGQVTLPARCPPPTP